MDEKDVILARLIEQNAELQKQNAALLELVASQAEDVQRLTTRLHNLESENARLRRNSSTSSKPPSSDIVKPGPKKPRRKGKGKRGGQHGHRKHTRPAFPPEQVVEKLTAMKLGKAAETVREGYEETLRYMYFPREHWRSLRTNNPLERIMKEIRRRTRVVGSFPDGRSALMLVAARLRHIAGTKWGLRRYLNMDRLKEHDKEKSAALAG